MDPRVQETIAAAGYPPSAVIGGSIGAGDVLSVNVAD
jgi:hypothetical protein